MTRNLNGGKEGCILANKKTSKTPKKKKKGVKGRKSGEHFLGKTPAPRMERGGGGGPNQNTEGLTAKNRGRQEKKPIKSRGGGKNEVGELTAHSQPRGEGSTKSTKNGEV